MSVQAAPRPERLAVGSFVRVLTRFSRFALPDWDKLLLRVLLSQVGALTWVLMAAALARAVDVGLQRRNARAFFAWLGFALGVQVLNCLFLFLTDTITMCIKMRVDLRLKRGVFAHLQRLSVRFQEARPVGENMFRVNSDTSAAYDVAANTLPSVVEKVASIFTLGSLVFSLNAMLAALIALYMVMFTLYSHVTSACAARYQWHVRQRGQAGLAMLQENLSAFTLSKAYGRERHERRRYFARMGDLARMGVAFGVARGLLILVMVFQEWFLQLAHVLFCGYLVISGRMTVGEYVAAASLIALVVIPLQELVYLFQQLRVTIVPALRVLETLDARPEIADAPGARPLDRGPGRITFDHVSFRYTPGGPKVLDNLSFDVAPGTKLAIVGVSGAGKSTVFNLLLRFYDPSEGRVLIDGIDLASLQLESYRRRVSIVLQENFLYSATIRDNILFGNPDASPAALEDAVGRAGLDDLLRRLPQGLDTTLKEGGNLSAGQKQRIAIARALVRDPQFLFLDEATASLDPITEAEVLRQLRELERGRTRIVISHNIASIRDADQILVLERGALVEQGTHAALLAQYGPYRRMWLAEEEQSGGACALAGGPAPEAAT